MTETQFSLYRKVVNFSVIIYLAFQVYSCLSFKEYKETRFQFLCIKLACFSFSNFSFPRVFTLVCLQELHGITMSMMLSLFHLLNQLLHSSSLLILLFLLCHHPRVTIVVLPPYFINSFYFSLTFQNK